MQGEPGLFLEIKSRDKILSAFLGRQSPVFVWSQNAIIIRVTKHVAIYLNCLQGIAPAADQVRFIRSGLSACHLSRR